MKSLSYLNTYASQSKEVTDLRPAQVKLIGNSPVEVVSLVAEQKLALPQPLIASEIVNYEIADLRLRFTPKSFLNPIENIGFELSYDPLVSDEGLTFVEAGDEFIEISGFRTVEQFNQFSLNYLTLPENYEDYTSWWVETSISWYDQASDARKTILWDNYDPTYYTLARLNSEFSLGNLVQKIKNANANTNSEFTLSVPYFVIYDFDLDFSLQSSLTSRISLIKQLSSAVSSSFNMPPSGGRARLFNADIQGAFDASIKVTYTLADSIILAASPATMTINAAKTAVFNSSQEVNSGITVINTRLRHAFETVEFDSEFQDSIVGMRLRLGVLNPEVNTTLDIIPQYARLMSSNMQSLGSLTFLGEKVFFLRINANTLLSASTSYLEGFLTSNINTVSALTATSSVTYANPSSNMQVISSMSIIEGPAFVAEYTTTEQNKTIEINIKVPEDETVTIHWGDSEITTGVATGNYQHVYNSSKIYKVSIVGRLEEFAGGRNFSPNLMSRAICLGDNTGITSLRSAFAFSKLSRISGVLPSSVVSLEACFQSADFALLPVNSLETWDTRNVTSLEGTFMNTRNSSSVSIPRGIRLWDTRNVTTMRATFFGARWNPGSFFNSLAGWDTGKVTTMQQIFQGSILGSNIDIKFWDTINVRNMDYAFNGSSFTRELNWNVSKVVTRRQQALWFPYFFYTVPEGWNARLQLGSQFSPYIGSISNWPFAWRNPT
jgi:hypothetical protein